MAFQGDSLDSPDIGVRICNTADFINRRKKELSHGTWKLLKQVMVPAMVLVVLLVLLARPIGNMVFGDVPEGDQGTVGDNSRPVLFFAVMIGAGSLVLSMRLVKLHRRRRLSAFEKDFHRQLDSLVSTIFTGAEWFATRGFDDSILTYSCLFPEDVGERRSDHHLVMELSGARMEMANVSLFQRPDRMQEDDQSMKKVPESAPDLLFDGVVVVLRKPHGKEDSLVTLQSNQDLSENNSGALKKLIKEQMLRSKQAETRFPLHGESLGLFSVVSVDEEAIGRQVGLTFLDDLHRLYHSLIDLEPVLRKGHPMGSYLFDSGSSGIRITLTGKECFFAMEGFRLFPCSIRKDFESNQRRIKATILLIEAFRKLGFSLSDRDELG